jgi:uncharacterized membrane protein YdfJ with MMPL/SSD domain
MSPEPLLVADASGRVTGQVGARLSPLRSLATAARGHPIYTAVALGLLVTIAYLETWNDTEVNRSIRDWNEASRFLKGDQFGTALQACIPAADDWSADDREAFETSMRHLEQEIEALTAAFDKNAELLKEAAEKYQAIIDGLVDALTPILLTVIAVIVFSAIPATKAFADAIGLVGASITVVILAMVWEQLMSLFDAVSGAIKGVSAMAFVADSRPGWAAPNQPDPNIKDIVIKWTMDPAAYK